MKRTNVLLDEDSEEPKEETPRFRIRRDGSRFRVANKNMVRFISGEQYDELVFQVSELKETIAKALFGKKGYLYSNDREDMKNFYSLSLEDAIGEAVFGFDS